MLGEDVTSQAPCVRLQDHCCSVHADLAHSVEGVGCAGTSHFVVVQLHCSHVALYAHGSLLGVLLVWLLPQWRAASASHQSRCPLSAHAPAARHQAVP